MASALYLDLSYITLIWLRACTVMITAVPLTPAGLGVREVGSVLLLRLVGVEPASAIALSILQFVAILFFAALGGLFEGHRYLLRFHTQSVTKGKTTNSSRASRDVPNSPAS